MLQLVEESLDLAFEVLGLAASPELDSVAPQKLDEWGPRVAAAAKAFVETAAKAYFDVSATWERPSVGRKRVELTAVESARYWEVLEHRGTDVNQRLIDGVLRTISDRRKIELEIVEKVPSAEGGTQSRDILSIDRGQLDFSPFQAREKQFPFSSAKRKVGAPARRRQPSTSPSLPVDLGN